MNTIVAVIVVAALAVGAYLIVDKLSCDWTLDIGSLHVCGRNK